MPLFKFAPYSFGLQANENNGLLIPKIQCHNGTGAVLASFQPNGREAGLKASAPVNFITRKIFFNVKGL
jgi:hypothetical protein